MIKMFDGIEVEIFRKKVKNLNLTVSRSGKVKLTIPVFASDEKAFEFVQSKINWLKKAIEKFEKNPNLVSHEYASGEKIMLLGREFELSVICSKQKQIKVELNKIILSLPHDSDLSQRKKLFDCFAASLLEEVLDSAVKKWETITGFSCDGWKVMQMKTLWGSYSSKTRKIHFNLNLIHFPERCIEYVVLHELAHSVDMSHGKSFKSILDKYMPNWRESKKELNQMKD